MGVLKNELDKEGSPRISWADSAVPQGGSSLRVSQGYYLVVPGIPAPPKKVQDQSGLRQPEPPVCPGVQASQQEVNTVLALQKQLSPEPNPSPLPWLQSHLPHTPVPSNASWECCEPGQLPLGGQSTTALLKEFGA